MARSARTRVPRATIRSCIALAATLPRLVAGNDDTPVDLSRLPPAVTRPVGFAREVRPLLAQRCVSCHGARRAKSGLRLDSRAAWLEGGDSGPAVVVGDSAASRVVHAVARIGTLAMPPAGKPALDATEVGVLRAWIDQGLAWDDSATIADGATAADATDRGLHWSFRPLVRPAIPDDAVFAGRTDIPRHPIDRFVLARLRPARLEPSPEADRATLIRRLALDLLGVLPAPREVAEFERDQRPDAWELLVRRMLDAPEFGERWGRHWLDAARYADSDGYEKDRPRPWAWRYRDWVIHAINSDLSFDQFTREQLAGDLLPGATLDQRVATGFHRNTLTNTEGGVDQEEFRVHAVVDRVNTTASIWLGLTVACAQCHSHKFDPITQREYYRLFAFFDNADEAEIAAPRAGEVAAYERERVDFEARLERREADAKDAPKPPATRAGALVERNQDRRTTHVLTRGDFLRPADAVAAGTLAVLHPWAPRRERADRLELAEWLVDAANPLTPRVTVNRWWQHLFGRGIVASVDDFGTRGERPSHPELLDWIACELIERGWSRKAMVELIVTSRTYRQSSLLRADLALRDPQNELLARQSRFRVESEIVRDISLDAAGLLVQRVGGPSVRPPLPQGVAELGYAGSVQWPVSSGDDRYRRGLYVFFQRTVPYPMLMAFDGPDSNVSCVRRSRSNTPLQSLTLLNDPVFFECAQAFGERLLRDAPPGAATDDERVGRAFRIALSREPTSDERERLLEFVASARAVCAESPEEATRVAGARSIDGVAADELAAWIAAARVLLNLDEFVTRE